MSTEEKFQQNIRRTTALHALKQISTIVEDEHRSDAATARFLRWLLRYGWIPLLVVAALVARLTGVY
jgi:hypothetical protein